MNTLKKGLMEKCPQAILKGFKRYEYGFVFDNPICQEEYKLIKLIQDYFLERIKNPDNGVIFRLYNMPEEIKLQNPGVHACYRCTSDCLDEENFQMYTERALFSIKVMDNKIFFEQTPEFIWNKIQELITCTLPGELIVSFPLQLFIRDFTKVKEISEEEIKKYRQENIPRLGDIDLSEHIVTDNLEMKTIINS